MLIASFLIKSTEGYCPLIVRRRSPRFNDDKDAAYNFIIAAIGDACSYRCLRRELRMRNCACIDKSARGKLSGEFNEPCRLYYCSPRALPRAALLPLRNLTRIDFLSFRETKCDNSLNLVASLSVIRVCALARARACVCVSVCV